MEKTNLKIQNPLKAINYKLKTSEGTAIYLSMFLLTGVLAIALAISTIAVGENRISKEAVNSMQAIYIADSAVEYAMYEVRRLEGASPLSANDVVILPPNECKLEVYINENYWSVNHSECNIKVDNKNKNQVLNVKKLNNLVIDLKGFTAHTPAWGLTKLIMEVLENEF